MAGDVCRYWGLLVSVSMPGTCEGVCAEAAAGSKQQAKGPATMSMVSNSCRLCLPAACAPGMHGCQARHSSSRQHQRHSCAAVTQL